MVIAVFQLTNINSIEFRLTYW